MRKVIKNSFASLIYQILLVVFTLINRTIFLEYLGVELLGISGTFSSIIGALSLTELGFQTAVVYKLFIPIVNNDWRMINKIMVILKRVYMFIGIAIMVLGTCMILFLGTFLKGIEVNNYIIIVFYLQVICSVATYFFSHKRILFYADQKEYITKSIDMLFKVIFAVLQIIIIIKFRNYILYLGAEIAKNILCNILIGRKYNQLYSYNVSLKFEKQLFKSLLSDVRKVFAAKLSNYIYTSTDNLIISACINTVTVGYVANYISVISQLKALISALLSPIIPFIGQNLVNCSEQKNKNEFMLYTHIRYFIASVIIVPTAILLELFVQMWIGRQYILDMHCLYLLISDFYISIVYAPCYEYSNAKGLFIEESNIMLIGAFMNVILSILLSHRLGVAGVYIGTVITQLFLWGSRGRIVFTKCLNCNIRDQVVYWIKMFYNTIIIIVEMFIARKLYITISITNDILKFIVCGIVCECVVLTIYVISQSHTKEFLILKQFINSQIYSKKI